MRTLLILSILAAALQAATLPELIESARSKHPTLEAIKARIRAADYVIESSKNFDNPVFGLGISDIRVDNPMNRSLEPMQTNSVSFSQKIPWFGKTEAKYALARASRRVLSASFKEAEAILFARIKESAYRLWEIQRLMEVTRRSIDLTEQNIELFRVYTATNDSREAHMGIISAELVKSRLKTSLKRLKAKKEGVLALLGYLSFSDTKEVEISLPDKNVVSLEKALSKVKVSPPIEKEEAKKEVASRYLELNRLQTTIDPVVSLGYFQREAYEDYISVGLRFSLPLYGSEKSKIEESKALLLARKSALEESKLRIGARIEELVAIAGKNREIVDIIENESLPKINHMFDLIRSDIATGADMYKFVDILEQKLRLDAEAISARTKLYIALAQIEAILGEEL